jgi:hypothetical protein
VDSLEETRVIRNQDRVLDIAENLDELLKLSPLAADPASDAGKDVVVDDLLALLNELRRMNAESLRWSTGRVSETLPQAVRPRSLEVLVEKSAQLKDSVSKVFSAPPQRGSRIVTKGFVEEAARLAKAIADEISLVRAATAVVIQCDPIGQQLVAGKAPSAWPGTGVRLTSSDAELSQDALRIIDPNDPWPFVLEASAAGPIDHWPWAAAPRFDGP